MPRLAGFINLDKPSGPTSHDMVALVRKRLGIRQVGHAGTLDPLATGVLVLGVGAATRLMTFAGGQPKEYVARLLLGRSTDSEDITGVTTAEASGAGVSLDDLERAASQLRGNILQTPPMVSAVKHQGRRLYELARAGQTVERQPRPVTIYSLEIGDFEPGDKAEATLTIRCSGGVYIRTICADLGRILGCGGCMAALRRTAVGTFDVRDSVSTASFLERGAGVLLPPSTAVAHLPKVTMGAFEEQRVVHGGSIDAAQEGQGDRPKDGQAGHSAPELAGDVRLQNARGELVAIAHTLELDGNRRRYQPYLVLASGDQLDRERA